MENGAGHEDILREFADEKRILLGTTAQGELQGGCAKALNNTITLVANTPDKVYDPLIIAKCIGSFFQDFFE